MYFKDFKFLSESGDQLRLQPISISLGYDRDIRYNFASRGTSDQTNLFLIDESINFYENYLGGLTK